MVSLTPERLVGILNENSSYCIPPLLAPAQTELLKHPTLLPGERILLQQDATCVDTFPSLVKGILHLTTFRIIFSGAIVQDVHVEEGSNCDDDPTEIARKGYIYQARSKKWKPGQSTLDRFRQKAQNFQESLQATKPSLTLKPSGRSKSKDLVCPSSPDEKYVTQPISDNEGRKLCKLISVQQISPNKMVTQPRTESISHDIVVSIPCTSIYEVRKLPKNSLTKGAKLVLLADGIELLCSTLQTYKFCLALSSSYNADKLTAIFSKYTKQLSPSKWFAIAYKEAVLVPRTCDLLVSKTTSNIYDFEFELHRLGLFDSDSWKIYSPEQLLCPRAPLKTLVPFRISESELKDIIAFHDGKSYPAICWRNQVDGTIMVRSGAALYRRGIFESRCEADENYLASICCHNEQSSGNKLVVFTEQSRNNSPGLLTTSQQISGQITPKQGEAFCYPHVRFVYTDKELIPDHKMIKKSSYALQALLSGNCDDKTFLSALAETQWLSQISELLETTSLIITALSTDKSSVLISYGDGSDRTAQLSSLSQLLLDAHYRTIDGFQVLIQKEWISFGHMFADRCISQKSSESHGPIFLQWLDCVWQLTNQFPLSFEFNEEFLQIIADHVYSCRFGTFLCNSEQEFKEEEIDSRTLSLWTWINLTIMADPERFKNNSYRKGERILIPRFHIPSLKVWESYYAKTRIEENLEEATQLAKDQTNLVEEMYGGLLNKYLGLLNKSNLQDDGQSSVESSIEHDISSWISSEAKEKLINDVFDVHNTMPPENKTGSLKSSKSLKYSNSVRALESRSLDNLLENRRPETQSKTKKRLGSSKFYVHKPNRKQIFETAMAGLNELKPEPKNHVRKSQMFDGLCDYLKSEGFVWSSEKDIEITPVTCCGFLTKLGNVRKNWLIRWFKLDLRKNCLAYFENRESAFPKGVIECDKILKVYADKEKSHKNKFCAATVERTYAFKAPNENIMKIWMAILSLPSARVNVR